MNRLSTLALQVRNKVAGSSYLSRFQPSDLDLQDVSNSSPFDFTHSYARMEEEDSTRKVPFDAGFTIYPKAPNLRRNKSERTRLQGIMQRARSDTNYSQALNKSEKGIQILKRLFSNEGGRRTFFACWLFIHALVFALGMVHYSLKGMF